MQICFKKNHIYTSNNEQAKNDPPSPARCAGGDNEELARLVEELLKHEVLVASDPGLHFWPCSSDLDVNAFKTTYKSPKYQEEQVWKAFPQHPDVQPANKTTRG